MICSLHAASASVVSLIVVCIIMTLFGFILIRALCHVMI